MTADKIGGHHHHQTSSTSQLDLNDTGGGITVGTPQKVSKKSTMSSVKNSGSVRKPYVKRACTNCKKAHSACTEERPCKRCVQLGIAHECVDAERKKSSKTRQKKGAYSDSTHLHLC